MGTYIYIYIGMMPQRMHAAGQKGRSVRVVAHVPTLDLLTVKLKNNHRVDFFPFVFRVFNSTRPRAERREGWFKAVYLKGYWSRDRLYFFATMVFVLVNHIWYFSSRRNQRSNNGLGSASRPHVKRERESWGQIWTCLP